MELTHFSVTVDRQGIATVSMDVQGESMNMLSPAIAADFEAILERLENDSGIRAAVFCSAKESGFIVGADVRALAAAPDASAATAMARDLQRALARLEALHRDGGKPVVAAIDGPCLGGGLELALACSMRVLSDAGHTILGLPEVKIGLFPGAGGTQRLPRLIGIANALDLILSGKNVRPKKALRLGLVDEVVSPAILLSVARERAMDVASGKITPPLRGLERLRALAQEVTDREFLQQVALEENRVGQRILFKRAREQLLNKTHGNYPGPERALEVLRIGMQEGLAAGFVAEADRFGQVSQTDEAKALMAIFFATQALKKETWVSGGVAPKPVRRVGLLGGGLMGGGIATVTALQAEVPVRIKEVDDVGMGHGLAYVRRVLDDEVARRWRSRFVADRVMQRVTGSTGFEGFAHIDLCIEAVPEDLALKRTVLEAFEAHARPDAIFASNTSSLPITDIAQASSRRETVIGMHYFSPVEKMPLLEIITTRATADWVTATCVALGKAQGKTVIVVRDGTGFYTSRILGAYMNEAAWLLREGASVAHLDTSMVDWGFPVGPITLLDEVGIDVAAKVGKILQDAFGERLAVPEAMDLLLQGNRLGRKNGKGFYLYEQGKKMGVDDSVYQVLGGRPPGGKGSQRDLPTQDVQDRLALQMLNEAARCLEEGILLSPRDGDIGAVFGLGFPPFRGGPFFFADTLGAEEVVRRLERCADRHGARFAPAQILIDHATGGKRFYPAG